MTFYEGMAKMVWRYRGLRLLRQDPWECLVSYICSPVARIATITNNVETIASLSQQEVRLGDDHRYVFPTAEQLANAGEDTLKGRLIGLKRLGGYVFAAAERVDSGKLDLHSLRSETYEETMQRLIASHGIGYKVANCVALFSLDKVEAFPVDRWIMSAMKRWYSDFPKPKQVGSPSRKENTAIKKWALDRFGSYSGYAGQYLFHGRRREEEESQLPFGTKWRGKFMSDPSGDPIYSMLTQKHL